MKSGAILLAAALLAQDTPLFRTAVDLLPVDVMVVDGEGRPITSLTAEDFRITVDGDPRRVASAEWVPLGGTPARAATPPPEGYSTNEEATGGRLIVIAIDQPNIRPGGGRAVTDAMLRFIDRLSPSDRVAVYPLGRTAPAVPFTANRDLVKRAVEGVNGQMQTLVRSPLANVGVTLSKAAAIERGELGVLSDLLQKCSLLGTNATNAADTCEAEIRREATTLLDMAKQDRRNSLRALADLLSSLKFIDAPKALLLVSEGFALFDEDLDASSELAAVGQLAAAARTTIYGLGLQGLPVDASAAFPIAAREDVLVRTKGFEQLTGIARGALFNVTTTGEAAFERITSELSGYYLLGIEAIPADLSRSSAPVRVELTRTRYIVRARSTVIGLAAVASASPQSAQAAAAAALSTPTIISTLPLRVGAFSLQGPDPSKVQVLIRADIGRQYETPQPVAIAYMLTDSNGRIADAQSLSERLAPSRGMASPLPFVVSAAVPPGDYVLKLAAVEGGRMGSVEHRFRAALIEAPAAAAVTLSDLIVGGPISGGETFTRPTVDYLVRFGLVQGYMEAYGSRPAATSVTYEIARDDQSPSISATRVDGRLVNASRALFSTTLSTSALPPGAYRLRAVVSVDGKQVATLSRPFAVESPAAMASAAPAADLAPNEVALDRRAEFFLPIEPGDLAPPFDVPDALRPDVLQPLAALVPAAARAAFDEGVAHLRRREWAAAETSFKRAIVPNADFTAATAYLAVTFAATNHFIEAANAWQTALIARSDLPQIHLWLGMALLHVREFARAQPILEEAATRWPDDSRFARPLAALYATTGRGYQAMEMLQRYLAANPAEAEALYLGVQWIYQLRANGAVLRSREADAALARTYADAYVRANGLKQTLVKEWLDYVERK
jgi:VWFA-related protein